MTDKYQPPSASTEPSEAGSDSEDADQSRGRLHLNNAHQSVVAQNIRNKKDINFVHHGAAGSSNGLTQTISGQRVGIQGGVKYEAYNYFGGNDDSTILTWLLSLSTFKFEEKQNLNFQMAAQAPGTGQWLLDSPEFTKWKNGEVRRLCCYGIPGAGKTILASIIVNYLQTGYGFNNNIACIYLYFDFMDHKMHNIVGILSNLLAQLVRNQHLISEEVKRKFEDFKRTGGSPIPDDLLSMLKSQMKSFSRVFLVVDALDECLNDTRSTETNTMDKFLKILHHLPSNVSVLFTSRNDIRIREAVKADCELEVVARDADLRKYFESQIDSLVELKRLVEQGVQRDKHFLDNVLGTVVAKSQGMFLLARLHIKFLASKKTLRDFEYGLDHLPQTPDGVYEIALTRIDGQGDFQKTLALNALTWLVFAERAMTITELRRALAVRPSDKRLVDDGLEARDLTSACAGIVVVDEHTGIVRLAHYTAEQYLQKNKSTIFKDPQSIIAEVCLTYLSLVKFSQIPGSATEVEDCCKEFPLLSYAADHWGTHVARGVRGRVYSLAWDFLSQKRRLNCVIQVMGNFQSRNEGDVSGVHIAAYFGLATLLRKVIELNKEFNINAMTRRHETALHWAAIYGQRSFLKLLLDEGADLNMTDIKGRTALHRAIANADIPSIGLLLASGRRVNLELEDSERWTPLRRAAADGNVQIVEMLLDSGAEINAQDEDQWTALRWAAHRGRKDVVALFIRNHVSLETPIGDDKTTLLNWAAREGEDSLIQLLIKEKQDLDAVDAEGSTALRGAIKYGRGMTAWLLIQARADINKPDSKGVTLLHWVADNWQECADKSLVWLLLENHAEINAQTKLGFTALHVASSRGSCSLVWLLLEKGAIPSRVDKNNRTALHCAVIEGHTAVAQILIYKSPSLIHATDDERRTPLHIAASSGDLPTATLLMDSGAKLDVRDREGYTPLHRAVSQQHESIAILLLKRGADPRIPSKKNGTVMQSAESAGNRYIMSELARSVSDEDRERV